MSGSSLAIISTALSETRKGGRNATWNSRVSGRRTRSAQAPARVLFGAEHFEQAVADAALVFLAGELFLGRVRDVEHVNGLLAESCDMG